MDPRVNSGFASLASAPEDGEVGVALLLADIGDELDA
jgi:hypothetical protein